MIVKYHTTGLAWLLILILSTDISALADTIMIGNKSYKGTFNGYKGSVFYFTTDAGKEMAKNRSFVRKLTLDKAADVTIVRSIGKQDSCMLERYENGRFYVEKNNKPFAIAAMSLKEMQVPQPAAGPDAGGVQTSGDGGAIASIDTSRVEAKEDLTEQQKSIISNYKSARSRYDQFLAESSAMIKKMDRASGAEREELLNRLRTRNSQEQPLKRALESATASLIQAFPEITHAGQQTTEGTPETLILTLPRLKDGEVMMIDTAIFKQGNQPLTSEQSEAIDNYNEAKSNYSNSLKNPESDTEALKTVLSTKQEEMFNTFPNMKIVYE